MDLSNIKGAAALDPERGIKVRVQESTLFKGGQRGAPVAPEETISKALIFHPRQRGGTVLRLFIPNCYVFIPVLKEFWRAVQIRIFGGPSSATARNPDSCGTRRIWASWSKG